MRRLVIGAAALLAAAGCSSKKDPSACPNADGAYALTVTGTGQSENEMGLCTQGASTTMSVTVQLTGAAATVGGQDCDVTSTSGCQIEIDCAGFDAGDTGQTAVRYVTFGLPSSAQSPNENALVELGPAYCAFQGTAADVGASQTSSSSGH
jgi:hypothetical protein